MAADILEDRQHVHQLIEQLGPEQIDAVARLLEVMVDPISRALAAAPPDDEPVTEHDRRRFHEGYSWFDDNPLSDEDRHAVTASREYFRRHPEQSASFEELAAECGFTMDQIRGHKD